MSATASPQPVNEHQEIIDFLRQLAGAMPSGEKVERLLEAILMIEALALRATAAELSCRDQQREHERSLKLRQAAELVSDDRRDEIAALKAQLAESDRQAETERTFFAEEARRLRALAEAAETRLREIKAELDELRGPATAIDQSIAIVPVQSLQFARAQFAFLANGFAEHGDVISQTICEIGACTIDRALTSGLPPGKNAS
jgi:hypothetical protein